MNKKIISVILIIVFLIFFYFYNTNIEVLQEKARKKEKEEYPFIGNTKRNYIGSVVKFSSSKYFAGNAFNIELNNGDKFSISGNNENASYKKKKLENNLQDGDSIFYDHKTYEFYIFKAKDTLKFKLFNSY